MSRDLFPQKHKVLPSSTTARCLTRSARIVGVASGMGRQMPWHDAVSVGPTVSSHTTRLSSWAPLTPSRECLAGFCEFYSTKKVQMRPSRRRTIAGMDLTTNVRSSSTLAFTASLATAAGLRQRDMFFARRTSVCTRRRMRVPSCLVTEMSRGHEEGRKGKMLEDSFRRIRASPVVLCVRMDDPDQAFAAASAAIRGGLQCIEITMTTPKALELVGSLSTSFPDAHIGAGTILTLAEADAAAKAGAKFALSPVVDVELIRHCNNLGMLAVPGAATPTEVHTAFAKGGARLVKLFPVNMYGGSKYVQALGGPLGHIPLLPTSGICLDSVHEYLNLKNVAAVGASRQIFVKEALDAQDWDTIAATAAVWVEKCAVVGSQSAVL